MANAKSRNQHEQEPTERKIEWLTPAEAIEILPINELTLAHRISDRKVRAKCLKPTLTTPMTLRGLVNTDPKSWTYVDNETQLKQITYMPTGIQSAEWGPSWTPTNVWAELNCFAIWAEDVEQLAGEFNSENPAGARSPQDSGTPSIEAAEEPPNLRQNPFGELPDLGWDEITITIVANDSVKIQARDKVKTVLYQELGLRDGRKGNLPTKAWDFLMELAENEGGIGGNSPRFNRQYKIRVKELRKKLRAYFGIKADPFHPYRKCRSYKPVFILKDQS